MSHQLALRRDGLSRTVQPNTKERFLCLFNSSPPIPVERKSRPFNRLNKIVTGLSTRLCPLNAFLPITHALLTNASSHPKHTRPLEFGAMATCPPMDATVANSVVIELETAAKLIATEEYYDAKEDLTPELEYDIEIEEMGELSGTSPLSSLHYQSRADTDTSLQTPLHPISPPLGHQPLLTLRSSALKPPPNPSPSHTKPNVSSVSHQVHSHTPEHVSRTPVTRFAERAMMAG